MKERSRVPGGVVILVLVAVWVRQWRKSREKARRLLEPNPANERHVESVTSSPLMDNAASPGMVDSYPTFDEKDPYAYHSESDHSSSDHTHSYPQHRPLPQSPPMAMAMDSGYQSYAVQSSDSGHSHNPYLATGSYAEHVPLPSSHDHSDYDYEYNSSSQDHQQYDYPSQPPPQLYIDASIPAPIPQYSYAPPMEYNNLHVDIPNSTSQYSYLSQYSTLSPTPTGYNTPDSRHSVDEGEYQLRTPEYPATRDNRVSTPVIANNDPYTLPPASISASRNLFHRALPAFPQAASTAEKGMYSPVRSPTRELGEGYGYDSPSSQKRWSAHHGRTNEPPVPDRPFGLDRYASGLSSDEHLLSREDERHDRSISPRSSQDHSISGEGPIAKYRSGFGSQRYASVSDDGYLYEVPTIEAVNEAMKPFKTSRNLYG